MYLISFPIYLFNNIILRVFIKLSIICTVFFLIFFASFFISLIIAEKCFASIKRKFDSTQSKRIIFLFWQASAWPCDPLTLFYWLLTFLGTHPNPLKFHCSTLLTCWAGGHTPHGNVAATVAVLLREVNDIHVVGDHRGLSLAHRLNAFVACENAATLLLLLLLPVTGSIRIRLRVAIFTLQQRRGDILVLALIAIHRG